jgi:hypothetical protein
MWNEAVSSFELQAASCKLQAASCKLQVKSGPHGSLFSFNLPLEACS